MNNRTQMQPVSADANVSAANVKPRSGGQNRLRVQKTLMEYLLLGKIE